MPAFEAGAPHPGAHPFDDQVAFEFRDRSDDDDDGPAQRTTGVDLLAETDELDVEAVQLVEDLQEVPNGPSDPVRSPDQHDIELATASLLQELIETRPARFRAGDPVSELRHDLEAALNSHLPKIVQLCLRVLIDGRDPQVKGGAFHLRRPFGCGECLAMYCSMNCTNTSVIFSPRAAETDLKELCSAIGTLTFKRLILPSGLLICAHPLSV